MIKAFFKVAFNIALVVHYLYVHVHMKNEWASLYMDTQIHTRNIKKPDKHLDTTLLRKEAVPL